MNFELDASQYNWIGLDAEALSGPEWTDKSGGFQTRLAVCFGFGSKDQIEYVEARDMTAGVFDLNELDHIGDVVSDSRNIIVAHNANYDLNLLNGTLLDHKLEPLPNIRYIDTMNDLKIGRVFRNTLAARCAAYGVNLKTGSPDWRAVLQRKREAWDEMRIYNLNDVVCALELAQSYIDQGLSCKVQTWQAKQLRPM